MGIETALIGGIGALGSIGSAVAQGVGAGAGNQGITMPEVDQSAYTYGGKTPEQRAYEQYLVENQGLSPGGNFTNGAQLQNNIAEWSKRLQTDPAFREQYKQFEAQKDAMAAAARNAPSVAQQEQARLMGLANGSTMSGVGADMSNFNRSKDGFLQAGANINAAQGTLGDATSMFRDAAMGNGPSAAQAQLMMGLDQNNAAAASMAAGARGGGGNLASAARDAINAQARNNAMAGQQAAMLRAQEQQAGMQGFSQAAQAGLGAAVSTRAQELQMAGLDADNAFKQAQLEDQQRQRNQQNRQFYEQARLGLGSDEANRAMRYQEFQAGNNMAVQGANADAERRKQQGITNAITGGLAGLGGAAQSAGMAGMMGGGGGGAGAPAPGARPGTSGNPAYNGGSWKIGPDGNASLG